MEVTVHLSTGPRTAAWDELWRRIFEDVLPARNLSAIEDQTDQPHQREQDFDSTT